jgi:hypothetical protein
LSIPLATIFLKLFSLFYVDMHNNEYYSHFYSQPCRNSKNPNEYKDKNIQTPVKNIFKNFLYDGYRDNRFKNISSCTIKKKTNIR